MPRDAAREAKVDFGPAYYFIASTYLVPAGSTIQSIEEVNRPGVRIVAISNTTTARSARRTAPHASVEEVPSVDLMTEMAATGKGDAFALSHDSFAGLLPKLPGARVLARSFPADRHCGGGAEGASGRAQDRDRTARKCEKIRSGAPRARCRGLQGCRGGAVAADGGLGRIFGGFGVRSPRPEHSTHRQASGVALPFRPSGDKSAATQKALAAVFVVRLLRQGCALISLESEPFDGHGGTSELRQVHRSIIYTALQ